MKHRAIARIFNRLMIAAIIAVLVILSNLLLIFLNFQRHQNELYTYQIANTLVASIEETIGRLESACRAYCYSSSMERFLRAQSLPNRYDAAKALEELINRLGSSQSDIDCIILVTSDGKRFNFKNSVPTDMESETVEYAELFDPDNHEKQFLLYSENQMNASRLIIRLPVYSLTVDDQYLQPIGSAVFICTTGFLNQIVTQTGIGGLQVELRDNRNHAISSNRSPARADSQSVQIELSQFGFTLNASMVANHSDLLYQAVPVCILGILTVMILLLICVKYQLQKTLITPVEQLTAQLAAVGDRFEDQHLKPVDNGCHELTFLTDTMNDLLHRNEQTAKTLLQTQSQLYEAELLKRQSEISALQSQINPHFLYNTLQCIRGLSFEGKTHEIAEIASCMGAIFHYSIKSPSMVSLADEINIIRKYLHIYDIRWDGRIHHEIHIPNELLAIRMPKMLLQPLVENAIYHGLSKYLRNMHLTISAQCQGNDVVLCVRDNGSGIAAVELERIQALLAESSASFLTQPQDHIGILNIHARIRHVYGDDYGLQIESKPEEGTLVRVQIAQTPLHEPLDATQKSKPPA